MQNRKSSLKGSQKEDDTTETFSKQNQQDNTPSTKKRKAKAQMRLTDVPGIKVIKKEKSSKPRKKLIAGLGDPSLPLLTLGELVPGTLVARPSKQIKSPYVADVLLEDGTEVLAHAPMLNCAGMVVPGAPVSMTRSTSQSSKTSHVIQLAHELRENNQREVVGAHPRIAETIAKELMARRLIPEFGTDYQISSQKGYGDSRVDFVLEYEDGKKLLVEVKNVVCADYCKDRVPEGRDKDGLYISVEGDTSQRSALFPHGKKKPKIKVVSDRAIKHVHELTQIHQQISPEYKDISSAVIFIVNRGDCQCFRPCHETDLLFAQVLHRAEKSGVKILAYDIRWDGNKSYLGKKLPVKYCGKETDFMELDEDWLQLVLEFNANISNTSTSTKGRKQK